MFLGLGLTIGTQGAGPPLAITSMSDDLGDTLGGHPLVIRITSGTATGVTIGGQPCTAFSQVGNVITCKSPALAAGVYDVQVTSAGDPGPPRVGGWEAWTWTVDVPAIRLFQADQGVTAATNTARALMGRRASTIGAGFIARDGAQLFELASGRIIMVGGWSSSPQAAWPDINGNPSIITNEILASDAKGAEGSWFVLLAHDPNPPTSGPNARFLPGHGMAFCTHVINGVTYAYVIGSDSNAGANRDGGVWRSSTGSTWERIATNAPTIGKSLMMCQSFNGKIHIYGGQTDLGDPLTALKTHYRSTNADGTAWEQLADAPWAARGSISGRAVLLGKMWMACGATYTDQASRTYFDDVWNYDDTVGWTQILATGHGQFAGRWFPSVDAYNGKLWILNGFNFTSGNLAQAISSSDGVTWTIHTPPWPGTHALATLVTGGKLLASSGDVGPALWSLEDVSGPLVSAWADQGSGALSLAQATAAERPTVVTSAFYGGVPGLAFVGGQALGLAAKDAAIASGVYECDARVRTEDATSPAQGDATIDTPNPTIDVSAGSKFNGCGLDVDSFEYHDGAIAWVNGIANTTGVKMNDGVARSTGARHANADLRLYVNGVQNGPTKTSGIGFSTTHTGWQHIGIGFYPANRGRFVIGYAVAAKQALSASTRAKGAKWARKFRTEP